MTYEIKRCVADSYLDRLSAIFLHFLKKINLCNQIVVGKNKKIDF